MLRRSTVEIEVPGDGASRHRHHEVTVRAPCKKMKKRRELDALVAKSHKSLAAVYRLNNGNGHFPGHGPLLKNDSDSGSDLEGFPSAGNASHSSSCCKSNKGGGLWVPAWLFLIVLIGTLVSATLLWLHIGLKQDFQLLRGHLQKVDAENKRVPDSLHSVDAQLKQLQENSTKLADAVSSLSVRVDKMSKDLSLVNGSALQLKKSIAEAVNNQLPSHIQQINSSLDDVQSKINTLSSDVSKLRSDLTSTEVLLQKQLNESLNELNSSVHSITEVLSGSDTSSSLSEEFNHTLQRSVEGLQNESSSRLQKSFDSTITEMKRDIIASRPLELTTTTTAPSTSTVANKALNSETTMASTTQAMGPKSQPPIEAASVSPSAA